MQQAGFREHLDGGQRHGHAGLHVESSGPPEAAVAHAAGHGFEGAERPDRIEMAEQKDGLGGFAATRRPWSEAGFEHIAVVRRCRCSLTRPPSAWRARRPAQCRHPRRLSIRRATRPEPACGRDRGARALCAGPQPAGRAWGNRFRRGLACYSFCSRLQSAAGGRFSDSTPLTVGFCTDQGRQQKWPRRRTVWLICHRTGFTHHV